MCTVYTEHNVSDLFLQNYFTVHDTSYTYWSQWFNSDKVWIYGYHYRLIETWEIQLSENPVVAFLSNLNLLNGELWFYSALSVLFIFIFERQCCSFQTFEGCSLWRVTFKFDVEVTYTVWSFNTLYDPHKKPREETAVSGELN